MKKPFLVLYVLAIVLAGFGGWKIGRLHQPETPETDEDVLATVNDVVLTRAWFIEQMGLKGGQVAGQYQTLEQKRELLNFLVLQELMMAEARALQLDDSVALQNLYRNALVDQFIQARLIPELAAITVSEREINDHFKANQEKYIKPARRRGAMIHVELTDASDESARLAARSRMDEALATFEQTASEDQHFGEVARLYSDDGSTKYQGGVIGWIINHPARSYKWPAEVTDALFSLQAPGDVSQVIETDQGFYLVRLVDLEDSKAKSFEQVKKGISNQLLQDKRQAARQQFTADLLSQADIRINTDMLAAIKPMSDPAADPQKTPPALPGQESAN